ncbi:MAG TPA: DUF552 domain-containing protein [Thermoplasmata archaeon]|nr:DUF552 domain-containing protein [Thermoplasmata archaeon]
MAKIQEKLKRTLGIKESLEDMKLDYLDIGKLVKDKEIEIPPLMYVKVAVLSKISHLENYLDFVREGNIMILDTGVVGDDEEAMEDLVAKLKAFVNEIDGDLAGISNEYIVITPSRVKIDRRKIRI